MLQVMIYTIFSIHTSENTIKLIADWFQIEYQKLLLRNDEIT